MKHKCFLGAILVVGLLLFAPSILAQEDSSKEPLPKESQKIVPSLPEPAKVEGGVDCFDYYTFGSVVANIESTQNLASPEDVMSFKLTVTNSNQYPIVDGAVYVKVFRKKTDDSQSHMNGFDLVDQFFVQDDISLEAKGTKTYDFQWKVPASAVVGEYQVASFFSVAKKFNMLGLSFTDDIVGNVYDFTVDSENGSTVELDKSSVKINEQNFRFAAFPPRVGKDEEVTVKVTLKNPTTSSQTVPVTWTLYSWDGLDEKNKVTDYKETVQLGATQNKELSYQIKDSIHPVYFLVVETQYQGAKSILDIRFVRKDVDQVRINFPSITKYPIKQGELNALFSCAHGMGTAEQVKNNKLVLSLIDSAGKEISHYNYEGSITGSMMGLKNDFTPQKNYENFTLKADLYTNGKLVDSAQMKYDCQKINPQLCSQAEAASVAKVANPAKKYVLLVMLVMIGLLLLIIAYLYFKKKNNLPGAMVGLLFCLAAGLFFGASAPSAQAKSATVNTAYSGSLYYYWNRFYGKNKF